MHQYIAVMAQSDIKEKKGTGTSHIWDSPLLLNPFPIILAVSGREAVKYQGKSSSCVGSGYTSVVILNCSHSWEIILVDICEVQV